MGEGVGKIKRAEYRRRVSFRGSGRVRPSGLFTQRFFALLNNGENGVFGAVAVCLGLNQFVGDCSAIVGIVQKIALLRELG
jgi:hypothetical protein